MAYLLDTGQDVLQVVLSRANESTNLTGTATSDYLNITKFYINRVYYDTLVQFPWPFGLKTQPGIINSLPSITRTATLTEGSDTVTLSTLIDSSYEGAKIAFSNGEVYFIDEVSVDGLTLTLDATYKSDSATDTATIYFDEYALASDCLKPWGFRIRGGYYNQADFESIRHMFYRVPSANGWTIGPYNISLVSDNRVRIDPVPAEPLTIEYIYAYRPGELDFSGSGAGDTPIIPIEHRWILADWALYYLYLDKNEPRAALVGQGAKGKLESMVTWYASLLRPRMRPRPADAVGKRR